jgi:hypothetical protein
MLGKRLRNWWRDYIWVRVPDPPPRRRVPRARDLLRAVARAQADMWQEKARVARGYNKED